MAVLLHVPSWSMYSCCGIANAVSVVVVVVVVIVTAASMVVSGGRSTHVPVALV